MKLMEPGTELDGFTIDDCIHSGGMAHVYRVRYSRGAPDPGFPMVMKVPRMTAGDGAENIVSFEVEHQILQIVTGTHVPRFIAAGDLQNVPYLVMEYVQGQTLQHWLDKPQRLAADEVARLGVAVALAAHNLHEQNTVHLDLKPANVMIRPDGTAVLLDFGLSCNALYPDLLAEQLRKAVGSPAWMAPEQVVGIRGDPRSDIFAIGVMLYQLATSELPFGTPETAGGLRQRLWMEPVPPRKRQPQLPPWLQEIILRCLEPEAVKRYPSAAHLALDLRHPEQVILTERGSRSESTGLWTHLKRWFKAAGMTYQPSPLPARQIAEVPIVMVALPHEDITDATLYSLRQAAARSLGTRPGARLACVTVISPGHTNATHDDTSETSVHRHHLARLQRWAQPLALPGYQSSCHVLESGDVAEALVSFAVGNRVNVLVLGAATHGLKLQRLLATVPVKVAMAAPCTVILVKHTVPFALLERKVDEGLAAD